MTTTAAMATTWAALEAALRQRRPVRVSYHGKQRLICPHALGCGTQSWSFALAA
jgi:predicted DNA-binding transcriptional regulator YafY